MRKYWGIFFTLFIAVACKEEKKLVENLPPPVAVEKPVITQFGFNLDDYHVVNDTVQWGDSFGELMLKNHVDYPKIVSISENYKDTFDVKKLK